MQAFAGRRPPMCRHVSFAPKIKETVNYCSAVGAYNNNTQNKSAWFQFTAPAFDVTITVRGAGSGGTLQAPAIALFTDCAGTELVGSVYSANNITQPFQRPRAGHRQYLLYP